MRAALLVLLFLLPLVPVQPVHALGPPAPIVLVDPAGDVHGDPVDEGAPPHIDLTEVLLDLDVERLRFEVEVADTSLMTQADAQYVDSPAVFTFQVRDKESPGLPLMGAMAGLYVATRRRVTVSSG